MQLNDEQEGVLNVVKSGANVFFTGTAGTGKSYLLCHIIAELRKQYRPDQIAITAPTGIAAVNVGGQTIHSFVGCGGRCCVCVCVCMCVCV
jgi:ATP-dependent DNA helicase PIF1